MSTQEIVSTASATISESAATTPDSGSLVARLDSTAAAQLRVLLDIDNPIPVGESATVVTAVLRLRRAAAWVAGPTTITVDRPSAPWDASTVVWAGPAVQTGSATLAGLTAGAADDTIDIDITAILQTAVDAIEAGTQGWYGLRLQVNTGGTHTIHSALGPPDFAPRIVLEWAVSPEQPADPQPTAGRAVSKLKPEFRAVFLDEDGDDSVSSIQLQVHTADSFEGVLTYDSLKVAHNAAAFDSNAPPTGSAVFPVLVAGTTYFWRMTLWDNHDRGSEWSDEAQFVISTKGTLAITVPTAGALDHPIPTITWTVTGYTQTMYSVDIDRKIDGIWQLWYVLPKTSGATTSVTVPDEYALPTGDTYRITVRSWDSIDREDMSGDRSFYSASIEVVTS